MQIIEINTEYIKMDQLIKFAGIVVNGSDAKFMIADGLVRVNGELCTQRGKKIRNGDIVEIQDFDTLEVKGPLS
ncbi:RNA-binding protein [Acetobacterium bakii]|uniref:RNA-binding protein n=2 Tax=Acetobacterium bakii TaxID=52689 RepID=A0A0L6U208_9FIRM|nr:RNA-binding S4 domain-containing protein [Acetobacterium bakii]KNZ42553.1 RNA-binding protein [Acetobacterium bakii]